MSNPELTELLEQRRRLRTLCAICFTARAMNDWPRVDDTERRIADLVTRGVDLPKRDLPGAPGLAQVVTAVLTGFSALELFEHPMRVFDRLGVAINTRDWPRPLIDRILAVAGPLDNVLAGVA